MNYEPIEEHHNKRATFLPQTTDDTTPCIQLAGIQIYTYLFRRQLRISIHYDTAEDFLLDDNDTLPTEISLSGTIVYDRHQNTRESCPTCSGFSRETTHMICMTCGTDFTTEPPQKITTNALEVLRGAYAEVRRLQAEIDQNT